MVHACSRLDRRLAVRRDPYDPSTFRRAGECEHRYTSDPALLRAILKVRDGAIPACHSSSVVFLGTPMAATARVRPSVVSEKQSQLDGQRPSRTPETHAVLVARICQREGRTSSKP